MGLGLIALAFIFVHGLQLNLNDASLIPTHLSYLLEIIGLLLVRKRVKPKHLNLLIVFTLLLFTFQFMEFYSFFYNLFVQLIFLGHMYLLLEMIYQLDMDYVEDSGSRNRNRFKTAKILFFYLHVFIFFYTNILGLLSINIFSLNLSIFALVIKLILTYYLAYHMYHINSELRDLFVIPKAVKVNKQSRFNKWILMIVLILAFTSLHFYQDTYLYQLSKNSVGESISFYGISENGDIILDHLGFYYQNTTRLQSSKFLYPEVYIKEDLCDEVKEIEWSISYQDKYPISGRGQPKEIEDNEASAYTKHHYEHYLNVSGDSSGSRVLFESEADLRSFKKRNGSLVFHYTLYDENHEVLSSSSFLIHQKEYDVYHYEEDIIKIENLQIDKNGIVIRTPNLYVDESLKKSDISLVFYNEQNEYIGTEFYSYDNSSLFYPGSTTYLSKGIPKRFELQIIDKDGHVLVKEYMIEQET